MSPGPFNKRAPMQECLGCDWKGQSAAVPYSGSVWVWSAWSQSPRLPARAEQGRSGGVRRNVRGFSQGPRSQ